MEEDFDKFLHEAEMDPNIIGFFLTGSRGKGLPTKYSDYDIMVIVKDSVEKKYKARYKKVSRPPFGFTVFSISKFRRYAELGSPSEWDRPSFTHVRAIIDKTGEIQRIIDEKGKIPDGKLEGYLSGYLDGYINCVYRSFKCFRDGNTLCGRIEAARSLDIFLKLIFGLDRRVAPFPKYLEWELKNYPLEKFPMRADEIISAISRVLDTGDIKLQKKLFKAIERAFRKEGYGYVFNSWSPDAIRFIKTFGD